MTLDCKRWWTSAKFDLALCRLFPFLTKLQRMLIFVTDTTNRSVLDDRSVRHFTVCFGWQTCYLDRSKMDLRLNLKTETTTPSLLADCIRPDLKLCSITTELKGWPAFGDNLGPNLALTRATITKLVTESEDDGWNTPPRALYDFSIFTHFKELRIPVGVWFAFGTLGGRRTRDAGFVWTVLYSPPSVIHLLPGSFAALRVDFQFPAGVFVAGTSPGYRSFLSTYFSCEKGIARCGQLMLGLWNWQMLQPRAYEGEANSNSFRSSKISPGSKRKTRNWFGSYHES